MQLVISPSPKVNICCEAYCQEEQIVHINITTEVPKANGQVEWISRIIVPVLAEMSFDDPTKWYAHVPRVQKTINWSHTF